jgi:hypothetical protein
LELKNGEREELIEHCRYYLLRVINSNDKTDCIVSNCEECLVKMSDDHDLVSKVVTLPK